MAYSKINLGTPNNNDGDSLYAGGTKINANFEEIYYNLGGSSANAIKIGVNSGATTVANLTSGISLQWSTTWGAFIPQSSNNLRANGATNSHSFYITNNSGIANDFTGPVNTAILKLENRPMFNLPVRSTALSGTYRGSFEVGLGQVLVTSLSVYTTGVVTRGTNALNVFYASSEDSPASFIQLLGTSSSGINFYSTPKLDIATVNSTVRTGSDSSNALAHTGFVQLNLSKYTQTSTALIGRRGVVKTYGDLTTSDTMTIDGIYHPKHCEGLIYNYNTGTKKLTLVTGAAAHWSYSTSGVAGIAPTTAISIVASYNPIIRTFAAGWTPQYKADGTTNAVIDISTKANTWYYLYYLGCLQYDNTYGTGTGNEFYAGSSNVVISSNRDIASVDAQIAAGGWGNTWKVIRRLGPVKSDSTGSNLLPFNIKRIDHGAYEFYWGLQEGAPFSSLGALEGLYSTSSAGTYAGTEGIQIPRIFISSTTINITTPTGTFTSAMLAMVPPIPGITAHLTVRHRPSAVIPYIYFYGDLWTKNSSISALYPPFEIIRSTTSGVTHTHNIQLPMSPDGCYIPDGTYGGAGLLSLTTSSGQYIRYAMLAGETSTGVYTSQAQLNAFGSSLALAFTVTGFRLAR